MTEIIDGKGLAKKIRENLKKDVDELRKEGIIPKFAVILVGDCLLYTSPSSRD